MSDHRGGKSSRAAEVEDLRARLEEAEQTLRAIRSGEVDALVIDGPQGEQVYSLAGVERVYRVIVETMNEAALTVSPDGTVLFCNLRFSELLELPLPAVISRKLVDFVLESQHGDVLDLISRALTGPTRRRLLLRHSGGPEIPVQFSGTALTLETGPCVCLVMTDLTELEASADFIRFLEEHQAELKKNQQQLTLNETRYRLLSETSAQLLSSEESQQMVETLARRVMEHLDCQVFLNFLADGDSGRLRLNASAGIPPQEADALEYLDYGVAVCGCVARDRQRVIAENIFNTPDARTELVKRLGVQAYCCHPLIVQSRLIGTLSFGTRTRPRFDPDEVDLMRTVADQVAIAMWRVQGKELLEQTVRERTAKLALSNAELDARARQLRVLAGELTTAEQRERRRLSKLLHDGLQQNLAAAKLQVGGLLAQEGEVRETALLLEELLGDSIRMSRSLSAELSPPALFEHGLRAGLEWLCRWMEEKHAFTVELVMAENVELAPDVKILLFESVRELLFNAAKHSGEKRATVEVRTTPGSGLHVQVRDRGKGFDPRGPGSGADSEALGLFSIRERLGLIGGGFEIDSAPGQGCRFDLAIPSAVVLPPTNLGTQPVRTLEPGRVIRLVVADDHALFRDGLVRLCRKEPDLEIVGEAENGREAIDLARLLEPHVVLMDVNMPEVNGIEATAAIHATHPGIRIIGLSMYEDEQSVRSMRSAGAVDYKTKGCGSRELLTAIRTCSRTSLDPPPSAPDFAPR